MLIERTPLEEAWENVLEIMRKREGAEQVRAWLEKLRLVGLEAEALTYRAPTKFIAQWVETNFKHKLEAAWRSLGQPVSTILIESDRKKAA